MIPAYSYDLVIRELQAKFETAQTAAEGETKMLGILFARPQSPLAQLEIIPNLGYFHRRSGASVDFFCAGYGAYWEGMQGEFPDQFPVTFDGVPRWLFSNEKFDEFRKAIEDRTTWRYQGGCELILANAFVESPSRQAVVDFSGSIIVVDLDHAKEIRAIQSIEQFFEKIFRFTADFQGSDPTWGFSDQMGVEIGRRGLVRFVLSMFPKNVAETAERAVPFVVRRIGKD
jgi:hypothetical protein